MARRPPRGRDEFALFDVIYEDGSRTSNRKVAGANFDGPDGDTIARDLIEAQDREIAERSGQPRARIKSIGRSARK